MKKTLCLVLVLFFSFSILTGVNSDSVSSYSLTSLEDRIPLAQEILYGRFEGKFYRNYINSRQESVLSIQIRALGSVGEKLSELIDEGGPELEIFVPSIKNTSDFGESIRNYEVILFLREYKGRLWINNFKRDHLLVKMGPDNQKNLWRLIGRVYSKVPRVDFSKMNVLITETFSGDLNAIGGNKRKKISSTLREKLHPFISGKIINRGPASDEETDSSLGTTFYLIILLGIIAYLVFQWKLKLKIKSKKE